MPISTANHKAQHTLHFPTTTAVDGNDVGMKGLSSHATAADWAPIIRNRNSYHPLYLFSGMIKILFAVELEVLTVKLSQ